MSTLTISELKARLFGAPAPGDNGQAVAGPVLIRLADVEPVDVPWLWPGRIALGRMTLLVGRPGEGKSFLALDIAARVTTGGPWPDGGGNAPHGSVLVISAEDDPADTIRPRLDACRADVSRVRLLTGVRRVNPETGESHEAAFALDDVHSLREAVARLPDLKLIIIDPVGSFLGGRIDTHRDNEVRAALTPVAQVARECGAAVLVIAHRRKSGGDVADDLALGSRAFTGIARAVWHLSHDPQNKARRLLLPGKCNLCAQPDGLAFTIGGEPPSIRWEREAVAMNADDALAMEHGDGGRGPEPQARNMAADWLRAELADFQEHPVVALREAARAAGLGSWKTIQRAMQEMGVVSHRASFGGGYVWRLPRPAPMQDKIVEDGETCPPVLQGDFQGKTANSAGQDALVGQVILLVPQGANGAPGSPQDDPPLDLDWAEAVVAELERREA